MTMTSLATRLKAAFDGPYAEIRDRMRAFIDQPQFDPIPPGITLEEHRRRTLKAVMETVNAGFSALPFAKEYGGQDALEDYLNFFDIISHQDSSFAIKFGVQFGLFGMGIQMLGTAKHHAKYIADIIKGKLLGGFAMTEIGGGSDVQHVQTEAIYDHERRGFVIHTPNDRARKAYIGNAADDGRTIVVFAQLKMGPGQESQGVHAFVVPIRDEAGNFLPGVTIEDCGHKIGLNGVDNGYISFDHVEVPYDALLDRFASIDEAGHYQSPIKSQGERFFTMIGTLIMGRIGVGMSANADAKGALAFGIDFANRREVFGDVLMDKQATQTSLLPPLANTIGLHFALQDLVGKVRSGADELDTQADAIKAKASDDAVDTWREVFLNGGGAAYMSATGLDRLLADALIKMTFEGANRVIRLQVAKNRLRKFNHEGGQGRKITAAKLLDLRETFNSFVQDSGGLLDPSFQKRIFAGREEVMFFRLAKNLRRLKDPVAVNRYQDDMIAYAKAYAERFVLDGFIAVIEEQTDPEVKAVLKDLCDLYAVDTMQKHEGWYLRNWHLSRRVSNSLDDIRHELCERIRPVAQDIVDAIAIPDRHVPRAIPSVYTAKPRAALQY